MKTRCSWPIRWIAPACATLALVACGGGGVFEDTGTPSAGDARNGTYTMLAADAREYTLTLDFDARTYRVAGNGLDRSGSFTGSGNVFQFQPGNATGSSGSSTTRFSHLADTVVGEFAVAAGAVPFVASRTFATSIPTTTTTFNMLGRTVDTASGTVNTTIQQGQITSDRRFRTCDDVGIFEMANCPAASVSSGTLTVSGDLFTAATPAGNVQFRLATVGADRILLRASASVGTTRRFLIGMPAANSFNGGTFTGGTTEPAWGSATVTTSAFSITGTSPAGVTATRSGNATSAGAGSLGGLLALSTASSGSFFAASASQIGAIVASPGSVAAPGFMEIGVRQ
jgi:hypothetical protein